MPHKHKRKRDDDASQFDLAPTSRARPLPAYKPPSVFTTDTDESSRKRRKSAANSKAQDDTPRAFARMMAWQAAGKRPSGLDDGSRTKASKKTKTKGSTGAESKTGRIRPKSDAQIPQDKNIDSTIAAAKTGPTETADATPQILPGESLRDFARRVDQSLPLTSIPKTSSKSNPSQQPDIPADIKPQQRLTKHNKRLQKMIADWRTTDAKLKEKGEEAADEVDDKVEEEDLLWAGVKAARLNKKGKKNKKMGNGKGNSHDNDDPWKDLEKKRKEAKQKNLQDVVQAPPTLVKIKSKFKTRDTDLAALNGGGPGSSATEATEILGVDVKDVPNSVGSLRRREKVSQTRKEIIEGYRNLRGKRLKGKELSGPGMPRGIAI